jgi:hypothetical protein
MAGGVKIMQKYVRNMKHYTLLVKQYEAGQKGPEKFMIRVSVMPICKV